MGILTTMAILIHEIPHEIVDFVILLRSGFSCYDAFKAQLSLSIVTLMGSSTIIYLDYYQRSSTALSFTLWILPLTAGGFIYIALTNLLPELLNLDSETDFVAKESKFSRSKKFHIILGRIFLAILGVFVMEAVNSIEIQ
ncbi:zinc transporter ZIP13-like protein [Sarcoptes scabiei]|uniref:Zinc transporter ZIP13-like protein n=1 Tax=Sarcoptes scabiei TaxID=52283 RepID=A0A132AJ68_SARSC|nr:zinc transporter ZIP13-like protein [Sarcoptes scabiei]